MLLVSREALILENLALRQQLLALRVKRPRRRLTVLHKLFWVAKEFRLKLQWDVANFIQNGIYGNCCGTGIS